MKFLCTIVSLTIYTATAAVIDTTFLRMGEDGTNDGTSRPLNQAEGDVGGAVFNTNSSWSGISTTDIGAANSTAYATFNGSNPLWGGSLTDDGLTNDNFGIEFWFRQDAAASGETEYMFVSNSNTNNSLKIGINTSGILDVSYHNITGFGSGGAITLGEWYHVAVIRDNGISTLYLNGLATAGTTGAVPNISGSGFRLAETPSNSGSSFVGAIDEFRAFNFDSGEGSLAVASLNTEAIPEPSGFVLIGLAGFALIARRRMA